MEQLSLNIAPRLSYSPDNFVLHSGVRRSFESVLQTLALPGFGLCFVSGPRRSGKTHFSIRLAEALTAGGGFPRLVDGAQLGEWIGEHAVPGRFRRDEALIVDDAQTYLDRISPGESGGFVSLVEAMRPSGCGLVLLSSREPGEFGFDNHIRSRILPGTGLSLGAPAHDELPELLRAMARQRGLNLKDRQFDFVLKRIGRDPGSIEDYLDRLLHLARVLGRNIKFPLIADAI